MRRNDAITLIAVYFFVMAALTALGSLAVLFIPTTALTAGGVRGSDVVPLTLIFGGLFIFLAVLAVLNLVAGIGLLKRWEWARWLAIGISVVALLNFPIGTIIGGLIIWYLIQDETRLAFHPRNEL